jgi:hypothetical protein
MDLGEGVKAVLSQDHLASSLHQEDFGTASYGARIIDHHHFEAGQRRGSGHIRGGPIETSQF